MRRQYAIQLGSGKYAFPVATRRIGLSSILCRKAEKLNKTNQAAKTLAPPTEWSPPSSARHHAAPPPPPLLPPHPARPPDRDSGHLRRLLIILLLPLSISPPPGPRPLARPLPAAPLHLRPRRRPQQAVELCGGFGRSGPLRQ